MILSFINIFYSYGDRDIRISQLKQVLSLVINILYYSLFTLVDNPSWSSCNNKPTGREIANKEAFIYYLKANIFHRHDFPSILV